VGIKSIVQRTKHFEEVAHRKLLIHVGKQASRWLVHTASYSKRGKVLHYVYHLVLARDGH